MTMWADYIREREPFDVFEEEDGFLSYQIEDDRIYIRDLYVKPHRRLERYASKMADQVCEMAKEKGCKQLLGSVSVKAKNATASLKTLLGYGMQLHSLNGDLILLTKEL